MVEFEFLIKQPERVHVHSDIEVFYVMDGNVNFILEDKQYLLKKDDFLVVNVDQKHIIQTDEEFLAACLHISYAELSRMLKKDVIFFWCNTAVDNNEICDEVRAVIKKIIGEQYHNKAFDEIYMNSLYYELLHILTNDFLLNKDDHHFTEEEHKFDERKHQISEYIRLNYDKQISLNDLAKKLFLSNAYLSKYIKKQFGMSFVEYVNTVRLNYAMSELLYSDKSVVRIAMDTGFASSAALNKVFREKYGITPTLYRRQWKNEEKKSKNTIADENAIRRQLKNYFGSNTGEAKKEKHLPEEVVTLNRDEKRLLDKNWSKMINIGAAADLLNSEMQKHVLTLKEKLGFQYIRFWDLYAPEMYLDIQAASSKYNFAKLDQILDFLVRNELKPYMELRVKPKKIVKSRSRVLLYKEMSESIENEEAISHFMKELIIHLIQRYTAEEVETWYFEIWKTELEKYLNRTDIADKQVSVGLYLDRFEQIAGILREYLPDINIGGGGFSLRYGEDNFKEILEEWKKRKELPSFISIYNYPYTVDTLDKEKNQTLDASFIRKHICRVRELMNETEFPVEKLHVTEWSFSVSNRNVFNDHCMKAAFLTKNMIDSIGQADLMGYWVGSDLYADYYDSPGLLNGCGGLLTKNGIPKPAYYSFEFMNRLGKYIRKTGDNYAVSDNGQGNWRIVCHNLKNLSYKYGLVEEDEVALEDRNNLFVDNKKKRLHFELPALREGRYLLRVYSVNQYNGSIQDEWMEMKGVTELSPEDLDYLSRITIPKMVVEALESQKGKLVFDTVLESNEIQFIHASYQF